MARVGGITPWLKIAHLAESFNAPVAPHFLMELHVSLVCAIPNALYLEHIPQLRAVTRGELRIENGRAWACLLYTSPSPRDRQKSRMPSSA